VENEWSTATSEGIYNVKFLLLCLALLLVSLNNNAIAQPPQEPPADVAGKWTIYSKNTHGQEETKFIELSQEGGVISGYFQGPDQSGPLSGTINQQHILFRTETPNVLTFRGRVDGPRVEGRVIGKNIQGTFHLHNRTAPFHAVRTE
jgi:hypothetical protein